MSAFSLLLPLWYCGFFMLLSFGVGFAVGSVYEIRRSAKATKEALK